MTDGTQDSQNIQGTGGPQTGNIGHGHVCFMEKGYEAATMRDIAAAMHVVPDCVTGILSPSEDAV